MITIYDLLEVDENASKEEIEKSYEKLILKYHKDPNLDDEANQANEIILNKLKIAYEIIIDDEKRKKYDKDLANKRAEELINNISMETSNAKKNVKNEIKEENNTEEEKEDEINEVEEDEDETDEENDDNLFEEDNIEENAGAILSKEEQRRVKKAAQKEFNNNLKKAQKVEEEYNRAYNEAYNNYLRKMGYKVKEPWTLKRVKNLIITILAIILVCFLAWIIPPTRNILINIYENNFIVKALVDIVIMIFKAILSIFKK